MTGLVAWSPYEYLKGQGSKPDAAFFDYNRREKPNGHVWITLVNRKVVTDDNGYAHFRGFKGSYKVEVSSVGNHSNHQAILLEENDRLEVVL